MGRVRMVTCKQAALGAALGIALASIVAASALAARPFAPDMDPLLLETSDAAFAGVRGAMTGAGDGLQGALADGGARVSALPDDVAPFTAAVVEDVASLGSVAPQALAVVEHELGHLTDQLDAAVEDGAVEGLVEVQAFGDRRAASLEAMEREVLEPLPAAIMETWGTVPDPNIPIHIVLPEQNPSLVRLVTDNPGAIAGLIVTDPQAVVDAAVAFVNAVPAMPGEAVQVGQGYADASLDALGAGLQDAMVDSEATAGALAGAVVP